MITTEKLKSNLITKMEFGKLYEVRYLNLIIKLWKEEIVNDDCEISEEIRISDNARGLSEYQILIRLAEKI